MCGQLRCVADKHNNKDPLAESLPRRGQRISPHPHCSPFPAPLTHLRNHVLGRTRRLLGPGARVDGGKPSYTTSGRGGSTWGHITCLWAEEARCLWALCVRLASCTPRSGQPLGIAPRGVSPTRTSGHAPLGPRGMPHCVVGACPTRTSWHAPLRRRGVCPTASSECVPQASGKPWESGRCYTCGHGDTCTWAPVDSVRASCVLPSVCLGRG